LENTEGAIKNGQPIDTGNTGHTRQRITKQKQISWTPLYANKTWTLLQTTGGKDEPNIVCMRKSWRRLSFHC